MKVNICFVLGCLPLLFLSSLKAQQLSNSQEEARLLIAVLEKTHYHPRQLDDHFSRQVFTRLLYRLDPRELYFTAADVKTLAIYKEQIDDELKGKSWKFLPAITALYKQKLQKAEKTIDDITGKPFNLFSDETIDLSERDSLDFALNEADYFQRWNRWLRYQAMWQMLYAVHADSVKDLSQKVIVAREPEVRKKVKIIEQRNIKRSLESPEGFENYLASVFLDVAASTYDPHTNYFSKADWQNFESELSPEGYSFGIELQENDKGAVEISRLVPSGPAWKSNELHSGDILLELKWDGKSAMDLTAATAEEVEEMLRLSATGSVEFAVKKANGLIKRVSLAKEKIREDEHIVKSYILKGARTIGYISLPGFYSDWETMSGNGCANDVAKEIIKLKEEGITGLILDLRYNGGGSLQEGLNLAGIFINEGPLLMMQGKDKKPVVMKDPNRGTVYDGPLVVMVNGQSASASEVLASTLQDYNRALIVGSRTFGKATGQIVLPLDTTVAAAPGRLSDLKSPYGIVKVTCEKLYRVNGKSAQRNGVMPQIYLTEMYDHINYRESSYRLSLPSDSVTKKVYYTPLKPFPVKELSEKSSLRTGKDPGYLFIRKLNDTLPVLMKGMEKMPLNFTAFESRTRSLYRWSSGMEMSKIEGSGPAVENTDYEKQLISMDSYEKETNKAVIRNIQADLFIQEAYHIISDVIDLNK